MPRSIRFPALLLLLFALASCGDTQEMLSPTPSMSKVGADAVAASATAGDGDEDRLPGELEAIAQYRSASNEHGAQNASAVIGAAGGSVRLGDFEMIVPPGAVSKDTRFSIQVLPEAGRKAHAVASFMPHREFAKPITLRVPLHSTESAGSGDAHVMWWDGSTWVPLPSSLTPDGRLETQTLHFSLYGTQRRGFTMVGG